MPRANAKNVPADEPVEVSVAAEPAPVDEAPASPVDEAPAAAGESDPYDVLAELLAAGHPVADIAITSDADGRLVKVELV